jgi:hypothetical protein
MSANKQYSFFQTEKAIGQVIQKMIFRMRTGKYIALHLVINPKYDGCSNGGLFANVDYCKDCGINSATSMSCKGGECNTKRGSWPWIAAFYRLENNRDISNRICAQEALCFNYKKIQKFEVEHQLPTFSAPNSFLSRRELLP